MSKTHYTEQQRQELVSKLISVYGNLVDKKTILEYCDQHKLPNPHFLISRRDIKFNRDYDLSKMSSHESNEELMAPALAAQVLPMKQPKMNVNIDSSIPEKDSTYVPFGFYKQLEQIIKSKIFYPVFITGLSGNGKTTMVEQVAAKLNRECIRVNISIETDEDDLIGGNTLQDGNVVYREGPVIMAMRRGAVLLIDEIDRGSNKLMCMQSILEGKPLFNKKTGEIVRPAPGFTVVATANTKGRGTEDGRFIAAQILDEAFLERFPITVEQDYPSPAVEKKILKNKMQFYGKLDEEFLEMLVNWADIIRKTFLEGGVDEIISTRRLVNIAQAYSIFNDREEAIKYCINRFDEDTKTAFMDLYTKLSPQPEKEQTSEQPSNQDQILTTHFDEDVPF
jgi:hypothetical protein